MNTRILSINLTLITLVVLVYIGFDLYSNKSNRSQLENTQVAAEFSLPTVNAKQGHEIIRLSDFRGKIVLLNFWASWCEICKSEKSQLASIAKKFDGKIEIIGVAVRDNMRLVHEALQGLNFSYTVAFDREGAVADTYQVAGVPQSFIIGPDGIIRSHILGPIKKKDLAHVEKSVTTLINRKTVL